MAIAGGGCPVRASLSNSLVPKKHCHPDRSEAKQAKWRDLPLLKIGYEWRVALNRIMKLKPALVALFANSESLHCARCGRDDNVFLASR
jgi:hypothetical protein